MQLVPDSLKVLLKSYTTRLAGFGIIAEVVLDYGLGVELPGWATLVLLAFIVAGRVVKQEAVSGPDKEPDYASAS